MITLHNYPGENFDVLWFLKGSTVRSKNAARDFVAGLKTIVGGELKGYTQMLNKVRDVAIERMLEGASKLNADAILGFQLQSSSVMERSAVFVAYVTAFKFT